MMTNPDEWFPDICDEISFRIFGKLLINQFHFIIKEDIWHYS